MKSGLPSCAMIEETKVTIKARKYIQMSNYKPVDKSTSEKKVWRYIDIAPCPHKEGHFFALQELLGAWVWDEDVQKQVFEDAELPPATRVTYMAMDSNGFARNVHSAAYNGDKYSQR